MHRQFRNARLATAAVLAAPLLLAGCGSGLHTSSAAGSGSCRTPGITAATVRVGMIYPNTGPGAAQFADFRAGVDARFGVENSSGGVGGRRLVYDWADDTTDGTTNLVVARRLVATSRDFAILEGSPVSSGSAGYLHAGGIPTVGVAGDTVWSTYDNMFTWGNYFSSSTSPSAWGRFVRAHGGTKAVVLRTTFSAASGLFATGISRSLTAAGIPVVGGYDVSSSTDLGGLVANIAHSGADVLVAAVDSGLSSSIAAALSTHGDAPKVFLTPSIYDPRVLTSYGRALAGTYVFVGNTPFELNLPTQQAYLAAMAKYAPQTQPADTQIAEDGWISADMAIRGLKAGPACPTRAAFMTGLRGLEDYSADGLINPPVNLATFRAPTACWNFLRVSPDGSQFQVVQPAPYC